MQTQETIPAEFKEQFDKQFIEQWRKEKRAEQIEAQKNIPGQIERIQAEIDQLLPQEARAKANMQELEKTLAAVQADLESARAEAESLHWQLFELRQSIVQLREQQAQYSSVVIDEFVSKMNKKLLELRNSIRSDLRPSTPNPITGKSSLVIHSNADAVTKACDYVRDAISRSEAMRLESEPDEEIKAKLDELEKNIPSTDGWTVVERDPVIFAADDYERYEAANELSRAQQFYK